MPHFGPHQKTEIHQDGFAHQQGHWGQQLCKEKRHWNHSGLPRTQSNTNTNNDVNIPLVGFDGFTLPQGRRSPNKKSLSTATLKLPMNQKYTSVEQHLYPNYASSPHSPTREQDEGQLDLRADEDLNETLVPVAQGEAPAVSEEAKTTPMSEKKKYPRTTYSIHFDGAQNTKMTEPHSMTTSGSIVGHRFPSAKEAELHLKPFVWSRKQDLITSTKSKFNHTEGIHPKEIEDSDALANSTTNRSFHSSLEHGLERSFPHKPSQRHFKFGSIASPLHSSGELFGSMKKNGSTAEEDEARAELEQSVAILNRKFF